MLFIYANFYEESKILTFGHLVIVTLLVVYMYQGLIHMPISFV